MVSLDVSAKGEAIDSAIAEAWSAFGTGLDILVNNAGVVESPVSLIEVPESEWETTIDVNLRGMALVFKSVTKRMVAAIKPGSIVNISSMGGTERGCFNVFAMYSATKAAVIHFSKAAAMDLGPKGIRVNCLCPGIFPSEMAEGFMPALEKHAPTVVPLARPGVMDPDLTGPLLFLVSDASAYVTGNSIIVEGGHSLGIPPLQ